ncbi:hypothetical protein A3D03_05110 [Candidatus Gottesmanbacteria bacterium RIFCSPHIGHO2_02_FULL_40_13]|uniref:LytR/CpsA/Psr regulator C-terminal domain-containing protein n=1 Tax=Candidatus Gottesmanbacteria bacterium RIFCSPHIGHO2_02_FULL_40_13 TaxID=1798384 RepID=A0A1F6ABK3_9BACT|nr:MAG: hypothetical protein A3D03_05110 [Candidatus Gottesmanbacteria bacterium RIFCSPHIGHO2_02_FULL_40_13]
MKFIHITKKGVVLFLIIMIVIGGSAGTSYYFYLRMQKLQKLVQNPQDITQEEIKTITAKLSSLIEFPQDEEPTLATILDKEKITDPFFTQAENNDKLLIFTKSGKAILYRPKINKVINFGIINISTASASNTAPVRVAVYNGTKDGQLEKKFISDLQEKITNLQLVLEENAAKTDYEKTLVVDLTRGTKGDLAQQMANFIKGTVAPLPDDEVKPAASVGEIDLLIIVGNDYGK